MEVHFDYKRLWEDLWSALSTKVQANLTQNQNYMNLERTVNIEVYFLEILIVGRNVEEEGIEEEFT